MLLVETIIECSNVAFDVRFWIADANRVLWLWDEILFQIPFPANAVNQFSHWRPTNSFRNQNIHCVNYEECWAAQAPNGGSWISIEIVTSRMNWRWPVETTRVAKKRQGGNYWNTIYLELSPHPKLFPLQETHSASSNHNGTEVILHSREK